MKYIYLIMKRKNTAIDLKKLTKTKIENMIGTL